MGLHLSGITKKYGDRVIFKNFSYEFKDNGLYILFGASGIGKTTLLRIICGLDDNFDGSVYKNDNTFSFCFQEYRLFPHLNALQNILQISFSNATDSERVATVDMLRRLSFTDEEMLLIPSRLSGGMKQRVSFARAVLKNSSVLLLDEPTKEVDRENARKMLEIVLEEAKKRLVILVTHNIEEIEALPSTVIKIGVRN